MIKKRSFFERLTGGIRLSEDEEQLEQSIPDRRPNISGLNLNSSRGTTTSNIASNSINIQKPVEDTPPVEEEGELTVDVYTTPTEIIVQTMVAGVEPQNLTVTITHEMVTIRGKREAPRGIDDDNYLIKELYWGSFSRTIELPQEIEPDEADAVEKHGLLIIKLPKINKEKQTILKVKSF